MPLARRGQAARLGRGLARISYPHWAAPAVAVRPWARSLLEGVPWPHRQPVRFAFGHLRLGGPPRRSCPGFDVADACSGPAPPHPGLELPSPRPGRQRIDPLPSSVAFGGLDPGDHRSCRPLPAGLGARRRWRPARDGGARAAVRRSCASPCARLGGPRPWAWRPWRWFCYLCRRALSRYPWPACVRRPWPDCGLCAWPAWTLLRSNSRLLPCWRIRRRPRTGWTPVC